MSAFTGWTVFHLILLPCHTDLMHSKHYSIQSLMEIWYASVLFKTRLDQMLPDIWEWWTNVDSFSNSWNQQYSAECDVIVIIVLETISDSLIPILLYVLLLDCLPLQMHVWSLLWYQSSLTISSYTHTLHIVFVASVHNFYAVLTINTQRSLWRF